MNAGKIRPRPVRAGFLAATALLFFWTFSGFAGEKTGMKTPVTKPAEKPRQDPGPGAVVWLDSATMIYYCAEHPSFGKTKQGYLIPEEHAKARRGRAFQGKTCS